MEIIKLNLIPSGVNPVCHCSQYDNGRVIRIELFNGLIPYTLASGDSVTLNVRKPDNTIITTSITATQGNNYVDITTTEQICACFGDNLCELKITNGSTVIGTLNFIMQVERDVLSDGDASQSVIEDLDTQVDNAVETSFNARSDYFLKMYNRLQYGTPEDITDANNAKLNSIVAIQLNNTAIINLPNFLTFNTSTRYFLLTLAYGFKTQYILSLDGTVLARRPYSSSSSSWGAWVKIDINDEKKILLPPKVNYSLCTATSANNTFFVSDNIIPSGAYIESFKVYTQAATNKAYLYILDASTYKVIYKQILQVVTGWNNIQIGFKAPVNCLISFAGVVIKYGHYATRSYGLDYAYSIGWKSGGNGQTERYIGDEISHGVSGFDGQCVMLPLQVLYTVNSLNNYSEKVKRQRPIVSFVDDDMSIYIPDTWGEIISQTGIKMGFACITHRIGDPNYNCLSLEQIKALYNSNGHEVYSHSFSHPDFNSENYNVDYILHECKLSLNWLLINGFTRGSQIIIYPGGINLANANGYNKMLACNRIYKYGVNAWGGVNSTPVNPMNIWRVNADTATLDELKAYVDLAIANNSLLVFMDHAHVLNQDKENQIDKLVSLIQYIQAASVEILPLGEALHSLYGW